MSNALFELLQIVDEIGWWTLNCDITLYVNGESVYRIQATQPASADYKALEAVIKTAPVTRHKPSFFAHHPSLMHDVPEVFKRTVSWWAD